MRLVSFYKGSEIRLGIETERGILDVFAAAKEKNIPAPLSVNELILSGNEGLSSLEKLSGAENFLPRSEIKFAPVTIPEKIICAGLNYIDHSAECEMELPKEPVLFGKFSNALSAHNEKIPLYENAFQYDYEAELVIVMGKAAKNISPDEADEYIFGYTAGNDLSARDLQFRSTQWLIGKSLDKFAPTGPCIVTKDEFSPENKSISCKKNGKVCQAANTAEMIFSCKEIVSFASRMFTLKPGDLIFTGTPGGVILGKPENEKDWIKAGDTVEIIIEGIGTLTNYF